MGLNCPERPKKIRRVRLCLQSSSLFCKRKKDWKPIEFMYSNRKSFWMFSTKKKVRYFINLQIFIAFIFDINMVNKIALKKKDEKKPICKMIPFFRYIITHCDTHTYSHTHVAIFHWSLVTGDAIKNILLINRKLVVVVLFQLCVWVKISGVYFCNLQVNSQRIFQIERKKHAATM